MYPSESSCDNESSVVKKRRYDGDDVDEEGKEIDGDVIEGSVEKEKLLDGDILEGAVDECVNETSIRKKRRHDDDDDVIRVFMPCLSLCYSDPY